MVATKLISPKTKPAVAKDETRQFLALVEKQSTPVFKWMDVTQLKSPGDMENASSILKVVKLLLKQSDEQRKKVSQPLNVALRNLNTQYKEVTEPLKDAEAHLKALLDDYAVSARTKLLAQAEAKAAKMEAKGQIEAADSVRTLAVAMPVLADGVQTRTRWKARVIDFDAVPREYMMINQAVIDAQASATKGPSPIPGVEFYPETSVVVYT